MLYYNIHTHQAPVNTDEKAIISLDLRSSPQLKTGYYYSAGIHPWYATEEVFEHLSLIAQNPNIIAIGEAGLDTLSKIPRQLQTSVFNKQIELAETLQKPLIIHCVKAWPELIAIYHEVKPTIPWIIHGFRGKKELADQLLHAGMYLSFGIHFQPEAVLNTWKAHRLFVETDDRDIDIYAVYTAISTTLAISPATLSQEIRSNLQTWPTPPFQIV